MRVLIVCPLGVAAVWENEARELGIDTLILNLVEGTIKERAETVAHWRKIGNKRLYILINYESYWRKPLRDELTKWQPQAVILDEAHRIKGRTTKQSKFAHTFNTVPCRIAMTATEIGNGYEDLFSLYRFLDPSVFGNSWPEFENRYLIYGGYMNREIKGYRRESEILRKIADTSFQISRKEALGQDPPEDVVVPVVLSAKSRKHYEAMKKEAIAEIDGTRDGHPAHGKALALIVLTSILRLQQITGGFVGTDTGLIDIGNEKIKVACELTNDALANHRRVVIYCCFRHDINRLKLALTDKRVAVIAGGVSATKREAIRVALNDGKLDVVLAQIHAASLGVDLSGASVGIFYSTGYSHIDFSQASDRMMGPRQKHTVTNYHLIVRQSVDEKVHAALVKKEGLARKIKNAAQAKKLFS